MEIVNREMLEAVANTGPTSSRGQAQGQHELSELEVDQISSGRRNNTLTSLAGTMRRKGFGEEAIRTALLVEN